MENNIQHLILLLALYLRFIAKIHNSQDDVNEMEWVIFLVKGKKMPPIGQVISFSYAETDAGSHHTRLIRMLSLACLIASLQYPLRHCEAGDCSAVLFPPNVLPISLPHAPE